MENLFVLKISLFLIGKINSFENSKK